MKILCLIVGIISFFVFIYLHYAFLLNKSLNKKKSKMFVKHGFSKYSTSTAFVLTIACLFFILFIILSVQEKYNPIQVIKSQSEYTALYNQGVVIKELSVHSEIMTLKEVDTEVEEDNVVYGVTSQKVYKINCDNSSFISTSYSFECANKIIFLLDKYVVVIYCNKDVSTIITFDKYDLKIYKKYYVDGLIVYGNAIDDKISIISINEALDTIHNIGVQNEDGSIETIKRINYLRDTNFSHVVVNALIDVKNTGIKLKGFCCGDYFIDYDEMYYYIVCNMYMNKLRDNKSFIFKYNYKTMKIEKYAYIVGNAYMKPYVEDCIYINTIDQKDNCYYCYKLDNNLNIDERQKIITEDNKVLDYLFTSAIVSNLGNDIYINEKRMTSSVRPYRNSDKLIVFEQVDEILNINVYNYQYNNFDNYSVSFTEDIDECKMLSYTNNKNSIKILFRTDQRVGYVYIDCNTKKASIKTYDDGTRIFIADEKIIIIKNKDIEIIK